MKESFLSRAIHSNRFSWQRNFDRNRWSDVWQPAKKTTTRFFPEKRFLEKKLKDVLGSGIQMRDSPPKKFWSHVLASKVKRSSGILVMSHIFSYSVIANDLQKQKKRSHLSPNHWPRILHQAHQQCENSSSNKVMICNKVQLLISWLLKFKWCRLHHPYSGRLVASAECSGTKISSSHSSSVPTDARWCGFPSHCQPDDQIVFLFAAQPQKLIQS